MDRNHGPVPIPMQKYIDNLPARHRYLWFYDDIDIENTYTNFVDLVIHTISIKTQLLQDAITHFIMRYIFDLLFLSILFKKTFKY